MRGAGNGQDRRRSRIRARLQVAGLAVAVMPVPSYISARKLAALLDLSPRTLGRYRVSSEGPKFHKVGRRVRYARKDVEAWLARRLRIRPNGSRQCTVSKTARKGATQASECLAPSV